MDKIEDLLILELDVWELECAVWHGKVLEGNFAHYCPDWDLLPIDETCKEFEHCNCGFNDG